MTRTLLKSTLLAAVSALAVALVTASNSEEGIEKMVGKPLQKIEMKTLGGKSLTNKDFKGKVVLIDFWATWCGPCVKASPVMEKFHKEFKSKGLLVIGANTSEEDMTGKPAREYRDSHKYTYEFTYNNDALAENWGVRGIPSFVLVDANGKVSKTYVGFGDNSEAEMRAAIKALLPKN